jgi:hypothetical protein
MTKHHRLATHMDAWRVSIYLCVKMCDLWIHCGLDSGSTHHKRVRFMRMPPTYNARTAHFFRLLWYIFISDFQSHHFQVISCCLVLNTRYHTSPMLEAWTCSTFCCREFARNQHPYVCSQPICISALTLRRDGSKTDFQIDIRNLKLRQVCFCMSFLVCKNVWKSVSDAECVHFLGRFSMDH